MNEMNQYTPSELVTQLVDGELDGAQQAEVYAHLSRDQALQAEFQEQLAIRESVKNDTEAFTPPAEATQAVFATLGLENPAAAGGGKAAGSLFKKLWPPVAAAGIAALITFLLLNYGYQDENIQSPGESNAFVSVDESEISGGGLFNLDIPVVSSVENESATAARRNNNNVNHRQVVTAKSNNGSAAVTNAPAPDVDNTTTTAAFDALKPSDVIYYDNNIYQGGFAEIPAVNNDSYKFSGTSLSKLTGRNLYFTARGISSFSMPSSDVPHQNVDISYMALGGYITLTRNVLGMTEFLVGFEAGQEPFILEYTNNYGDYIDNSNYQDNVTKNAHLWWATFNCRGEFDHISGSFAARPYFQLGIGGSRAGAIGKCSIGLQYDANLNFSIFGGIEGSTIYTKYQGESWSTEKFGLTGGLKFKF